jgi:hypothetical protein
MNTSVPVCSICRREQIRSACANSPFWHWSRSGCRPFKKRLDLGPGDAIGKLECSIAVLHCLKIDVLIGFASLIFKGGRQLRTILAIASLIFLFTGSAKADSLDPTVYDVAGTITLPGNNACSGICTETIGLSFQYQWALPLNLAHFYIPPSSVNISSSGPLGTFSGGTAGFYSWGGFIPFINAAGDEIDLNLTFASANPGAPPVFLSAELFQCFSQTCQFDFQPPQSFTPPGVPDRFDEPAFANFTVTAEPESGTASMMLLGLGILLSLSLRKSLRGG